MICSRVIGTKCRTPKYDHTSLRRFRLTARGRTQSSQLGTAAFSTQHATATSLWGGVMATTQEMRSMHFQLTLSDGPEFGDQRRMHLFRRNRQLLVKPTVMVIRGHAILMMVSSTSRM